MTVAWTLISIIALLLVVADLVDVWLTGPRLEAVRLGVDGVQTAIAVAAMVALLVVFGVPLSAGYTALVGLAGLLIGYAVAVFRGFTVKTGTAIVHQWRGVLVVAGLSGAVLILGSIWLGDGAINVGLIGILVTTAATVGRYLALYRAATVAAATLVAEALVLNQRACRTCGALLDVGSRQCRECGAVFGGFCRACGFPVAPGDSRCAECGTEISPPVAAPADDQLVQRYCVGCGSPIDMTARSCPECSMSQPDPCPVCGNAIFPGDEECLQCGFGALDADHEEVEELVRKRTLASKQR
jgi:ribosomal protein L40E